MATKTIRTTVAFDPATVARLEPLLVHSATLEALHADGLLTPPKSHLDLAAFLAMPTSSLSAGHSLGQAIIAEREETR